MDTHTSTINNLFEQLGLEGSDEAIEQFVSDNGPIAKEVPLWEADFWSPAQASLLKQMKEEDADWAPTVDELDVMLR